jgi:hypothetical protein
LAKKTVVIKVTDQGLKETLATAKELQKTLDNIASKNINVGGGGGGAPGKDTSKGTKKNTKATKESTAANKEYNTSAGDVYRSNRGISGTSGKAGRDMSNMAKGMGGFVHVYATIAAKAFALSAAFEVLKSSMDTSIMVQGLEQMGAASGKNLKRMAESFQEATDGAVSLAEAMKTVSFASSAGMGEKQLASLARVAKGASLALGRSLPDAVDRLTRGVVKLEPEILDELGLIVKLGPATEKYARAIGKNVNQLTAFERQQAFANETIEQGEKKFGALADKLKANPYDKLISGLADASQSALSFINAFAGPKLEALAGSASALFAILILGLRHVLRAVNETFAEGAVHPVAAFKTHMREASNAAKIAAAEVDKAWSSMKSSFAGNMGKSKEAALGQARGAMKGIDPGLFGPSTKKSIIADKLFDDKYTKQKGNQVLKTTDAIIKKAKKMGIKKGFIEYKGIQANIKDIKRLEARIKLLNQASDIASKNMQVTWGVRFKAIGIAGKLAFNGIQAAMSTFVVSAKVGMKALGVAISASMAWVGWISLAVSILGDQIRSILEWTGIATEGGEALGTTIAKLEEDLELNNESLKEFNRLQQLEIQDMDTIAKKYEIKGNILKGFSDEYSKQLKELEKVGKIGGYATIVGDIQDIGTGLQSTLKQWKEFNDPKITAEINRALAKTGTSVAALSKLKGEEGFAKIKEVVKELIPLSEILAVNFLGIDSTIKGATKAISKYKEGIQDLIKEAAPKTSFEKIFKNLASMYDKLIKDTFSKIGSNEIVDTIKTLLNNKDLTSAFNIDVESIEKGILDLKELNKTHATVVKDMARRRSVRGSDEAFAEKMLQAIKEQKVASDALNDTKAAALVLQTKANALKALAVKQAEEEAKLFDAGEYVDGVLTYIANAASNLTTPVTKGLWNTERQLDSLQTSEKNRHETNVAATIALSKLQEEKAEREQQNAEEMMAINTAAYDVEKQRLVIAKEFYESATEAYKSQFQLLSSIYAAKTKLISLDQESLKLKPYAKEVQAQKALIKLSYQKARIKVIERKVEINLLNIQIAKIKLDKEKRGEYLKAVAALNNLKKLDEVANYNLSARVQSLKLVTKELEIQQGLVDKSRKDSEELLKLDLDRLNIMMTGATDTALVKKAGIDLQLTKLNNTNLSKTEAISNRIALLNASISQHQEDGAKELEKIAKASLKREQKAKELLEAKVEVERNILQMKKAQIDLESSGAKGVLDKIKELRMKSRSGNTTASADIFKLQKGQASMGKLQKLNAEGKILRQNALFEQAQTEAVKKRAAAYKNAAGGLAAHTENLRVIFAQADTLIKNLEVKDGLAKITAATLNFEEFKNQSSIDTATIVSVEERLIDAITANTAAITGTKSTQVDSVAVGSSVANKGIDTGINNLTPGITGTSTVINNINIELSSIINPLISIAKHTKDISEALAIGIKSYIDPTTLSDSLASGTDLNGASVSAAIDFTDTETTAGVDKEIGKSLTDIAPLIDLNEFNDFHEDLQDINRESTLLLAEDWRILGEEIGSSQLAAFSGLVTGFSDFAATEEKFNSKRTKLQEKYDKASVKDKVGINKLLNTLESKKAKADLSIASGLAGSMGDLMDKGSKAQQAFYAIEKAIHLAKMGMIAYEMTQKLMSLGVDTTVSKGKITNKLGEATVDAGAGIIKAISSMPFPLNIVAGVVTAGLVYGLLSSIGGSGGSVSSAAAKEPDRVSSSATLETPGEKSDSLKTALENIEEIEIKSFEQGWDVLYALRSIDSSMTQLSTDIIKGMQSLGGVGNFGIGDIESIFGDFFGEIVEPAFLGLFGGSTTTTELLGAGVEIVAQKLADVIDLDANSWANLELKVWEKVKTTVTSGGFLGFGGGTDTSTETKWKEFDTEAEGSFAKTLFDISSAVLGLGEDLGFARDDLINNLRDFEIAVQSIDLKDLSPEEQATAVQNALSSIANDITLKMLPAVENWRMAGEEYLEALSRVYRDMLGFKQAFSSIGLNTSDFLSATGVEDILDWQQKVLRSSKGGFTDVKGFLSSMDNFGKALYSQGELAKFALDNAKDRVGTGLQELGLAAGTNVDDFRTWYESKLGTGFFDDPDKLATMIRLGEAFGDMTSSADDLKDAFGDIIGLIDELKYGELSTLTQADKYEHFKSEAERLAVLALSGDVKAGEQLADAVGSMVELSKTMFGGVGQFMVDKNWALQLLEDFTSIAGLAMGGIFSGGFRAFAKGGMVSQPTLGLVGEGRFNEAVVPLPDGRSIPVIQNNNPMVEELSKFREEQAELMKSSVIISSQEREEMREQLEGLKTEIIELRGSTESFGNSVERVATSIEFGRA